MGALLREFCLFTILIFCRKIMQISSDDKILWSTDLSFDPTLIELLLALYSEATLVVVPHEIFLNPNRFLEIFANHGITCLQIVPSLFLRWTNPQIEHILNNSSLRILAFGGEEFPNSILQLPRKKDLKIFNLYGISELSCWASIYEIKNENVHSPIPLGHNLCDTELCVARNNELFLKSTNRYCIVDGISNKNELIETGDTVEVLENKIYFTGRKNKIVKRFGHKVNLNKIENIILKETNCKNKCVWSQKYKKILSFILLENYDFKSRQKIIDKIRVNLLHTLPEDHFPDYFEGISKFPLTSHGKINEIKLEQYYSENLRHKKYDSNIPETFSSLWYKYLGLTYYDNIDCEELSFFHMGGNSILATQLLMEFKEFCRIDIPEGLTKCLFQGTLQECLNCLNTCDKIKRCLDVEQNENKRNKLIKITGKKLTVKWKYDFKACVDSTVLIFTNGSNTYIAAGSYSHIFAVIDKNGQEISKIVLPDVIESTPCVSNCNLFIGCFDGNLYCINYIENKIIWKYFTNDRIKCSPVLSDNKAVIFGSYDQFLYCVKLESGDLIWKTRLNGSIAANIIKNSGHLFVSTIKGFCYHIDEINGNILWSATLNSPIFGQACILSEENVVCVPEVEGYINCISLEDGNIKQKFKADGLIFSSLVSYNNHIYFGCFDGNLYKVNYDKSTFETVTKICLNSPISRTPFIDEKNKILSVACNSGFIYLINLEDYIIASSCNLPNEVFSSPILNESDIYVGCRDNFLYCISQ